MFKTKFKRGHRQIINKFYFAHQTFFTIFSLNINSTENSYITTYNFLMTETLLFIITLSFHLLKTSPHNPPCLEHSHSFVIKTIQTLYAYWIQNTFPPVKDFRSVEKRGKLERVNLRRKSKSDHQWTNRRLAKNGAETAVRLSLSLSLCEAPSHVFRPSFRKLELHSQVINRKWMFKWWDLPFTCAHFSHRLLSERAAYVCTFHLIHFSRPPSLFWRESIRENGVNRATGNSVFT